MKKKSYDAIFAKVHDIYEIPPNTLRMPFLTDVFKHTTSRLKWLPFRYLIPIAIVCTIFLYLFFGKFFIMVISVMRYGF